MIKATQVILHQRMDERLRPLGVTVSQYACLRNLEQNPGITGAELARRTFVSRQSMNALIQGLERRGLVERGAESGRHGERAVVLTPAAASLLTRAVDAVDAVVERMTGGLEPAQQRTLSELLVTCQTALGEPTS